MKEILPKFIQPYFPLIQGVVIAIAILVIGWIISKIIEKAIRAAFDKAKVDAALGRFVGSLIRYAVLAATFIAALGAVGVQTTSVVAIFASAGLAVGLALQGSLANFASGVMILFFRPFSLGDVITAAGSTGTVNDIGIFNTTLLTPDNETVIIGNKAVTGSTIINITKQGTRRGHIDVGVAYGTKIEDVIPILKAAAESAELTLKEPAPAVAFVGLGASSIDFKVFAWAKSPEWLAMKHNLLTAVYTALNDANIEIPFPQQVNHQAPTPETQKAA